MSQPSQRTILIQTILKVIKKYCDNDMPTGVFKDVADIFGISRERVRQIAKKVEIVSTFAPKHKYCNFCGKRLQKHKNKFCNYECNDKFRKNEVKFAICMICNKEFTRKKFGSYNQRKTCSPKCRMEVIHQKHRAWLKGARSEAKKIHEAFIKEVK